MTDPLTFLSVTPRLTLPLLFAGQSQKEVTVNEALTLTDLLLHGSIEGSLAAPPAAPVAGQAWLVAGSPTGDWSGHAGAIAGWSEGGWRFVTPQRGMRLYDKSVASFRLFDGGWQVFQKPADPSGGTVVDVQARTAISQLISALVSSGTITA